MEKEMDFNDKKVLVTGGAGFVGANVVEKLVERGAEVTILDDLSTGNLSNIDFPKGDLCRLVEGSVLDYDLVNELIKTAQIVIHLAAKNIIFSLKNPWEDYEVNIGGTLNILLASRDSEVERVVYASSASVYGNPRYLPINEDDSLNPLSPYSVSKLGGENYCRVFYEMYDVPVTILRYSNVFGIRQDPLNPYCGVVAKFIKDVSGGISPVVHGDGQQTRDFTFVDDVVDATLLASRHVRAEGHIFNVATEIETSINDLVRLIVQLYRKDLDPEYIDKRDIDNIRKRVLNIEKIRRILRWAPRFTITDGLKRTIDWYEKKASPDPMGA